MMARFLAESLKRKGAHPRTSVVVLMAVFALTIVLAGLEPASSFGAEPPFVSSVSPSGGPIVGGTSVDIRGGHFTGATAVKFGSAPAASFTVVSGSRITANAPAGTGAIHVTVTAPGGTSVGSSADLFVYGPTISGVSPNRGPSSGGTSVSITGSDFAAITAVKFGSTNATSFKVNSQSSITAVSPTGTGAVDVTVVDPEATSPVSSADQFSYVPPPTVLSVTPAGGAEAGGNEVMITVSGTNPNEVTAVDFGMSAAFFFVNNQGSITAFAPPGVGVVDVTVTAFGGISPTSSADQFSYEPPPTVTAISPETGPAAGGSAVTITGSNFEESTTVDFGSTTAASVVVNSPSSITAVSPSGIPGDTVDVTVTTLGGTSPTSAATRFRYLQTAPLLITRITPTSGAFIGGTPVVISGSAFVGATAVHFGSADAIGFAVKSQHTIKAIAPAGAGTVDISVTTPEGVTPASSADQYSYVASPPSVAALSRSEGREQGAAKISIKGTGFIGATEVHFGSAQASRFVVNENGTAITAVYPAAELVDETTVDVTVTTPEGTSPTTPADRFTYLIHAPVLFSVSAHKGPAAGGTTLNISGEHLIHVTAVDFGAVSAASFTVNSSRSITATSPPATSGKVNVSVTTLVGVSGPGECIIFTEEGPRRVPCVPRDQFVFQEPTITNIAPNTGSIVGGTTLTITGTGFGVGTTATAFHFGGAPLATSVNCTSSTSCTAVAPAHKPGVVDIKAKVVESEVGASRLNPPTDQFTYN
jgi:hypothetical protein